VNHDCTCGHGEAKGKHHEPHCPAWKRYYVELDAEYRRACSLDAPATETPAAPAGDDERPETLERHAPSTDELQTIRVGLDGFADSEIVHVHAGILRYLLENESGERDLYADAFHDSKHGDAAPPAGDAPATETPAAAAGGDETGGAS
jgi:hypothetical protein